MRKYALLVGVEDYRDKRISRLEFVRADATALADRLRERCGFNSVHVLVDEAGDNEPLAVNVSRVLEDISADLRPEDLFLFFFAGHGVEKDGRGYLLTRDTRRGFPEHGSLSLEELRKTFKGLALVRKSCCLTLAETAPTLAAETPTTGCGT